MAWASDHSRHFGNEVLAVVDLVGGQAYIDLGFDPVEGGSIFPMPDPKRHEPCIIFRRVIGSRAYGLEGEGSDTDRRWARISVRGASPSGRPHRPSRGPRPGQGRAWQKELMEEFEGVPRRSFSGPGRACWNDTGCRWG